jgi:hypothetical protein
VVVNARYVKQVPGRKTDVKDSEWLASLAHFGLLRSSFIPKQTGASFAWFPGIGRSWWTYSQGREPLAQMARRCWHWSRCYQSCKNDPLR